MTSLPQLTGANLLTNSRMSCQKTCARKHYYRYELGIRKDGDPKPLRMGGAVHSGLDSQAKGQVQSDAIYHALRDYATFPSWAHTPETQHDWLTEREIVKRLLSGYWWRWNWNVEGVADNLRYNEIIASEISFNLPIRNPETGVASTVFRVAGKIDKIVRLGDGRLAVMEHKTCGEDLSPDSDYWKRLRIDHQISLYMLAAREMGHDVQTVLYDVLRKPSIAPRQIPTLDGRGDKIVVDQDGERVFLTDKNGNPKGPRQSADAEKGYILLSRVETPEEFGERFTDDIAARPDFYYVRQEIPRLDSDLEEFRAELWQQQQSIRDAQRHGRWFRNTSACLVMGRCEYLDLCHNGIQPGEVPSGFVRVSSLHPELKGEIE